MNVQLLSCLLPALVQGVTIEAQTPARLNGQRIEFYEVQDLASAWVRDFEAPELGVARAPVKHVEAQEGRGDQAGLEPQASDQPTPQQVEHMARTLEQLVRTYMQPSSADVAASVRAMDTGTLVVSALPEQHEWVGDFLAGLRGFNGLVDIQTTIYSAPRGVLQQWGFAPSATLATPETLEAFLKQIEADGRFEVVNAPRLVLFPCQRAFVSVIDQLAYVRSWQVQKVEPGGQEIADPDVATIQAGVTVEARIAPLPGERFGVQIGIASCSVERPIPTRKVRLGGAGGHEVEIGEPEVKTARFDATLLLADGASAVLVTDDTHPERDLAVALTVRKVAAQRSERK
jgi:hypothetical protein